MKDIGRVELRENENRAIYGFKQILLKRFPQADIILYGSKARGDYDEFSDGAIRLTPPPPRCSMWGWKIIH